MRVVTDPAVPEGTAYVGPYPSLLYVAAWAPLASLNDETIIRAARRRCLANLSAQVRSTRLLGGGRPVGELCDIEARSADDVLIIAEPGQPRVDTPYVFIATARVTDRAPR